jgi:arginyl-tRNA synthetase
VFEWAVGEFDVVSIATYAFELALSFSKFYRAAPILKAEESPRTFRLWLVTRIRETLADAYGVIGIPAL